MFLILINAPRVWLRTEMIKTIKKVLLLTEGAEEEKAKGTEQQDEPEVAKLGA